MFLKHPHNALQFRRPWEPNVGSKKKVVGSSTRKMLLEQMAFHVLWCLLIKQIN